MSSILRHPSLAIALCALGAVGCGGDDDDDDTGMMTEGLIIPCDVQEVLVAKCQRCHGDPLQNGAPFPLITLEQVHMRYGDSPSSMAIYTYIAPAVESGFMPLMSASVMPPVVPLTDEEKTILLDWVDAGAAGVEGPASCL
jgi:hypothetical protein